MGAVVSGEGPRRERATRALVFAFGASLLLHTVFFVILPRVEELSALVPPEPLPLIARLVRPEPPQPPELEPKPAAVKPRERAASAPPRAPGPVVRSAPAPAPVPERPAEVALAPLPAPQPAPAPAPAPAPEPALAATKVPEAATPVPSAPAPRDDAPALEQFRQAVIGQAARYKRYPRVAIDNGWEGEVRVRMAIGADGRIEALRVVGGSGHAVLDRQALEMFRSARPRVPIPAALRGRSFELELRAVYSLRDQRSG